MRSVPGAWRLVRASQAGSAHEHFFATLEAGCRGRQPDVCRDVRCARSNQARGPRARNGVPRGIAAGASARITEAIGAAAFEAGLPARHGGFDRSRGDAWDDSGARDLGPGRAASDGALARPGGGEGWFTPGPRDT